MTDANPLENAPKADWMKPIRNAGRLAAGRGVQAICSVVYLGVAARALNPADFGLLVVIHAMALAIARFSGFGSKEMLVRFGSMDLADNQGTSLRAFVWHGIFLDVIGTLLAWIVIFAGGGLALRFFDIPEGLLSVAQLYWLAGVAIMNCSSTPTGILRLFDRFQLIAYQSTVEPLLRLGGAFLMMWMGLGLPGFLGAWFIALLAGRLSLILIARHVLAAHAKVGGRARLREVLSPAPGIWRFVMSVQWTTTIGLVNSQLPLLAVGGAASASAAGFFKVAQQITSVLDKANSKLIVPSLYTELSVMNAQGATAERRMLVFRLTGAMITVAAALFIVLLFFGRELLVLIAGHEFAAAYPVMLWLAAAGAVSTFSVTLEPLLMAAGRMRVIILAGTLPLVFFIPMIFGMLGPGGLEGVGMATLLYALCNASILAVAGRVVLGGPPSA